MLLAVVAPREEEEFVTELRHVPEGWLALAGVAVVGLICWAVVWMYMHEGRIGASKRIRIALAVIRCTVIVMLLAILLDPIRVRILRRWIDSYTIVLADDSSSMDLRDTYRDPLAKARANTVLAPDASGLTGRSALVERILERDDRAFLRKLAENNRIKFYTFSEQPHLRGTIRAAREAPTDTPGAEQSGLVGVNDVKIELAAFGSATNIERALRRSVESLGSAPIAGVIVLTDGGFNQGASVEETARFARERELPIHVIGIGDPASPRNVRVVEVLAPPNAFKEDPFSITVRLAADGLDGETLEVFLRERGAHDNTVGRIVERRQVSIGPGGSIEEIVFERSQQSLGRFAYTVEVTPLEGESVADDNSKQTTVNVIDSRTRVLLIAGGPSWEYRFVSRLLERDATFDVSCWLQSADLNAVRDGNTIIDHLPILAEELFEYDVVILMDPDREEIDESWCRLIDTLVTEYGGGLLFTAARAHTPSFLRDRTLRPLYDLLPVTFDPEADIILNEVGHYQLKPASILVPETSYGHQIMQQADDIVTTKLAWRELGDVYWYYPVLREKPVATVLMRHADRRARNAKDGRVLAAVQFVGAGRTGYLGFDSTWRWRRLGIERFDRFWVQLIRYLAEGKLLGGTTRGTLMTESDEYSIGEAVTVTARLLDSQYKPIRRDEMPAQYTIDGERNEMTLRAQRDRPGWFEGRFVPDRTGTYRITMKTPRLSATESREIAKIVRITRPNIEILRPQMGRAGLVALAEGSSGGQYFEVDRASEVPDLIPDLHEEISIRSRPTTLWDNWKVMALLMTLLSIEWGVRKWNRLL